MLFTLLSGCSSGLPLSLLSVPKSERTTVHKNLIFALAAGEALLMFSELAKTNQVSSAGMSYSAHVARLQRVCQSNRTEVQTLLLITCNWHLG